MSLDQLISRLEVATTRLEALAGSSQGSAGGNASSSSAGGDGGEMVEAYNEILNGPVKNFVDVSNKIGGEVKDQGEIFHKAFLAQRDFIAVVGKSKKPSDATLQDLLKPTSELISQAQDFREKHRNKKEVFNHLSAISEGIPALGWVMMTPKPSPYVVQMKEAAEFYTNRVLKEAADDNHKNWARAFPTILNDLANFVKKYHTTGLVWNPKGSEATASSTSSSSTSSSTSTSTSTSKPTPAPTTSEQPTERPNLFAALNKGGDITSGLKKVDKSQMTHKNPELRAGGVVQAKEEKEKSTTTTATKAADDKPPKFALEGNKWSIEFQKNNSSIVVDQAENKHVIYIYKCTNSTVIIKGKVNAVTLDGCKKVGLVCDNIISSVDVINCQSCQVQITGKAPTVSIDKTDGLQVFLSKDGLDTEVFSSKSSEMNILIPGKTEDADLVEVPIPEQFKTTMAGGKFSTTIVEHSGG